MSHVALQSTTTNVRCCQVRQRTEDLRRSLDEVVGALSVNAHLLTWEACLSKFSAINVQVGGFGGLEEVGA